MTRLTDDDHLKEVSVKREEKPAPVTQEVDQEAETSQQEVKIEATSQQEAAEDPGKESINRTDDEKEVADESLVAGEGYVLCNRAGDIEAEERKVCRTWKRKKKDQLANPEGLLTYKMGMYEQP